MTPRQKGGQDSGFTLLEMIVVLAILGLMVGLVIAHGPLRSAGLDARSAASMLAGTLRAARSQAIADDRPVPVAFDGPAGLVRVGAGPARPLGARLDPPARPLVFLPDGSSVGARIGVAAGTVRKVVAVDWLTGRVAISDAP